MARQQKPIPHQYRVLYIGRGITALRHQHNLTQTRLSEISGIAQVHIKDLELDRYQPTLGIVVALARAFKIPVGEFIERYAYDESRRLPQVERPRGRPAKFPTAIAVAAADCIRLIGQAEHVKASPPPDALLAAEAPTVYEAGRPRDLHAGDRITLYAGGAWREGTVARDAGGSWSVRLEDGSAIPFPDPPGGFVVKMQNDMDR